MKRRLLLCCFLMSSFRSCNYRSYISNYRWVQLNYIEINLPWIINHNMISRSGLIRINYAEISKSNHKLSLSWSGLFPGIDGNEWDTSSFVSRNEITRSQQHRTFDDFVGVLEVVEGTFRFSENGDFGVANVRLFIGLLFVVVDLEDENQHGDNCKKIKILRNLTKMFSNSINSKQNHFFFILF